MLTIGRTLMGNPELLLLDEPSEGLAPLVVEHLLEQVGEPEAPGPHHPAGRAGGRFLARPCRPRLCAGEGRRPLRRRGRRAARRSAAARRPAGVVLRDDQLRRETMPFVNIQILKGHPQARKDEISRRVTDAISEVAQLPQGGDLGGVRGRRGRGLVCRRRRVSELKKQAARNERRDPRSALQGGRRRGRDVRAARHRLPVHRGAALARRATSTCCSATCRAITCAMDARAAASRPSASRARSRTAWPGTARDG